MIERIKQLPQTMETPQDLFDLAVQYEDKANGAANNAVYASRNSFCLFATTLTINNSNLIGVHATSRSSAYIGTIQGTNNKGTGIQSTNGSMVAFAVRNITAAASFLTQNGGRIYTESQTSTPNY